MSYAFFTKGHVNVSKSVDGSIHLDINLGDKNRPTVKVFELPLSRSAIAEINDLKPGETATIEFGE